MENSPIEFIVVAEARADAQIATELADRVFCESEERPPWLEEDLLDGLRSWVGFERETTFTPWKRLKHLVREQRFRRYLGFTKTGEPGAIDFAQARKAIIFAEKVMNQRPIRALLLVRDMDRQPERRQGMEQAREAVEHHHFEIVVGAPDPKREAWVLNGFVCQSKEEEDRLAREQQQLGFDPCERAEQLTASTKGAKRNAKRVLDVLTQQSYEREAACWQQTNLKILKQRGEATGLRAYLDDIQSRLIPLMHQ